MNVLAIKKLNKEDHCNAVIETCLFQSAGRQFDIVGVFPKKNTVSKRALFPNKKFGLNGKHLTVGVNYVSTYKPPMYNLSMPLPGPAQANNREPTYMQNCLW